MQPSSRQQQQPESAISWVQISGAGGSRLQGGASSPGLKSGSPFQPSDSSGSSSSSSWSAHGPASSPASATALCSSGYLHLTNQQQQQQQRLALHEDSSSPMISAHSSLLSGCSSNSSASSSQAGPNSMASVTPSELLAGQVEQRQQELQEELLRQQQQDEEKRKLRLQLYVFVLRCISYSFNAKPSNLSEHLHERQQLPKLRRPQLEQIIQLHSRFIQNQAHFAGPRCPHHGLIGMNKALDGIQQRQLDKLYERSHRSFNAKFLQNERMRLLVEAECCSQQDLRELYRRNAQHILQESNFLLDSQQQQTGSCQQVAAAGSSAASSSQLKNSFREFGSGRKSSAHHHDQVRLRQPQHQAPEVGGGGAAAAADVTQVNRETILNSWMIKLESILREEAGSESLAAECVAGLPGGSLMTSAAQVNQAAASSTPTTNPSIAGQQKQQQQQSNISKDQLYQMFQNILSIKKFEHQLLYNALQLDSADEQAAAIRRELDGRVARIGELERNKKLMPKFVLKEMESLYLEETRMSVSKLMVNLDSLPVTKGGSHAAGLHLGSAAHSSPLTTGGSLRPSALGVGGGLGVGSSGTQALASANESRGVSYGLQKFRRYNSR